MPVGRIGSSAGHHHLEVSLVVILVMPIGAQAHQLSIEGDANAAAHAHHHRLAIEGFKALPEVGDNVLGDDRQALFGANDGFDLCPLGLELLLTPDLLTLGGFLELWVDCRFLALVEGELSQSAFVVDRYRGLVLDGALDVIDADVVTEYGAGIGVPKLDRRSGESNKGGIGQGIAHVAGQTRR